MHPTHSRPAPAGEASRPGSRWAVAAAILIATALTGCLDSNPSSGELGAMAAAKKKCGGERVNSLVLLDVSGSQANGNTEALRRQVALVRDAALTTAACSGTLRVLAFSGSVRNVTVRSVSFDTEAGTDQARLRIGLEQVDEKLMSGLGKAIEEAGRENPGASSIKAQLYIADDFRRQIEAGRLDVVIQSDGIETVDVPTGVSFLKLSAEQAHKLAAGTAVPRLTKTRIRIAGVGVITKPGAHQLSPRTVEALKTYWRAICLKATEHMDRCLVTTDTTTS